MAVAGKTGTTEEYNDLWFVGYTPYYTCAVWSGYDNNEKLPDYARSFHRTWWRNVMSRIHADLEYAITVYPEDPVITEAPEDPGTEDPVITEPPEDPSGGGEDGYYDEESGMYIYY